MQILYLHQYFVPPDGHGGTRSFEFTRRLVTNGHEVTIITSSANLPPKYQNPEQQVSYSTISNISLVVINVPYSNSLSYSNRIRAFLHFALLASREVTHHQADVVFATSTPLTIAIPSIVARLWHRIPMVFEVRDLWPELPIAVGALRNPIAQFIAKLLEWIAYHSAKHIIALSPGMAEGIMKRGIISDRITIIPNSSDVDLFDVPKERGNWVRERLGLTPDQPLIVYTGTFGLINGVEYLVEVAHEMLDKNPNVYFLLVGGGKQNTFLESKAKTLGVLDQNLTIWSPLPKIEIVDVLAAATIATSLFLPIKAMENNSANKFFDALAAGKPIAINYSGWQREILEESGAGIILPHDDIYVATTRLAEFVTNKTKLSAAQKAAKSLATEQFNRDHLFEKFEQVIQEASY